MIRVTRITSTASRGAQRAGAAWSSVDAGPSVWVARAASIAFTLVIGLPLLALLLLALLVATVVFALLWMVNRVLLVFRPRRPDTEGRENVRVIRRVE